MKRLPKEVKKAAEEHIKQLFKEHNFRHCSGYNYKRHGDNIVMCSCRIGKDEENNVCAFGGLQIKKYSYDDIWADMLGEDWNWLHRSLSLRVRGAFVTPSTYVGGNKYEIVDADDTIRCVDRAFDYVMKLIDKFDENYTVNQMVIDHFLHEKEVTDPDFRFNCHGDIDIMGILAYIDIGRTDLAVECAKNYIEDQSEEDLEEVFGDRDYSSQYTDAVLFCYNVIDKYGEEED